MLEAIRLRSFNSVSLVGVGYSSQATPDAEKSKKIPGHFGGFYACTGNISHYRDLSDPERRAKSAGNVPAKIADTLYDQGQWFLILRSLHFRSYERDDGPRSGNLFDFRSQCVWECLLKCVVISSSVIDPIILLKSVATSQ